MRMETGLAKMVRRKRTQAVGDTYRLREKQWPKAISCKKDTQQTKNKGEETERANKVNVFNITTETLS